MSCIDDILPLIQMNGAVIPMFAQIGLDGALMGPLVEKLWAKINGCYERIQAGWQHESLRVISGSPATDFLTATYSSDAIWDMMVDADENGYIIGCGTDGTDDSNVTAIGLRHSHAYAIFGVHEMTDTLGNIIRLVHVQNPWRFEIYSGSWCDEDVRWTQDLKD